MKKFPRTYQGIDVWYDDGTNFWESATGLRAKQYEDLKIMIDDKPQKCIIIDGRVTITFHEVISIEEDVSVKFKDGAAIIASRDKHFKDTPENMELLKKVMRAHNRANKFIGEMEKL